MSSRKRDTQEGARPPYERFYIYIFLFFMSWMIADLVVLHLRSTLLPNQLAPARPQVPGLAMNQKNTNYGSITSKNIFNRMGDIPPPYGTKPSNGEKQEDAAPVLSSLPLTLVGTIVSSNEDRSIATVELKSQNKIIPVGKSDSIEGMATVEKVERGRLVFRNANTNQLEYIELAKEGDLAFGSARGQTAKVSTGSEVSSKSETEFELARDTINKYTSNLTETLQQAVARPNINAAGVVDGFKIIDMQPGSIYEKLGLKRNDVLKEVNGDTIDNPAKAMQMFNTLKNSDEIRITVDRNGRPTTLIYNIR